MSHTKRGFALAFGSAFLFSTKPILIKWMYGLGMTYMPLLALRMIGALPFYLIIGAVLWVKMEDKPHFRLIIEAAGVGLLGYYLASFLDLWGLEYVSAQLERIVLYAYPTFVVLIGILFMGKRLRLNVAAALFCAYIGIGLIYGQDINGFATTENESNTRLGTLLILASALSFASYVVLSKRYINVLGSLFFTCVSMTSASIASVLHYLLQVGTAFPAMNQELWLGVVILVVFATVIPTFMTNAAIHFIGPERVGISGTLGPLITTGLAIVYLGESFTLITGVGMVLVLAGVKMIKK